MAVNEMRPVKNEFVLPPPESFNTETMQGSMQQILATNIGTIVNCDFLIGTGNIVRKEGILYSVGRSYFTIMDTPAGGRYTVCDIFSLKFITFIHPNQIQAFSSYRPPEFLGETQNSTGGTNVTADSQFGGGQNLPPQTSGGFRRMR